MSSWLDTQTKALLSKTPPKKLAPSDTVAFTLVLLSIWWHDESRLLRAVERIGLTVNDQLRHKLRGKSPLVLKTGLVHADALLGQFELICCDAISVFIDDDVVAHGDRKYLEDLYTSFLHSDEFVATRIRIDTIPQNARGEEFIDQFLGAPNQTLPKTITVPCKKARIMEHWAQKIGGRISELDPPIAG